LGDVDKKINCQGFEFFPKKLNNARGWNFFPKSVNLRDRISVTTGSSSFVNREPGPINLFTTVIKLLIVCCEP